MAENYKELYHWAKYMLDKYQDEIVPGLREQLEKRVEVVRCKECKHRDWRQNPEHGKVETVCKHPCGLKNPRKEGFCGYGVRKTDGL